MEVSTNCNCGYPEVKARNGCGHDFTCPEYKKWDATFYGGYSKEIMKALSVKQPWAYFIQTDPMNGILDEHMLKVKELLKGKTKIITLDV